MTDMRDTLKQHIVAVLEGMKHLDVDSAGDLIAEVADEIAGERTDDLFNGAILDGIRWGYHAAVVWMRSPSRAMPKISASLRRG